MAIQFFEAEITDSNRADGDVTLTNCLGFEVEHEDLEIVSGDAIEDVVRVWYVGLEEGGYEWRELQSVGYILLKGDGVTAEINL